MSLKSLMNCTPVHVHQGGDELRRDPPRLLLRQSLRGRHGGRLSSSTAAPDEEVEERPPGHVLEDDDEEGVAVVDLEHAHHVPVRGEPRQDPHLAQDVVNDVLEF